MKQSQLQIFTGNSQWVEIPNSRKSKTDLKQQKISLLGILIGWNWKLTGIQSVENVSNIVEIIIIITSSAKFTYL